MAIEWDNTLSLGIPEIDEQHKEIFARFDKISLACQEGHGSDVLNDLLVFLDDYVVHHFSEEETLMKRYDYPGLAEQRKQHAGFIRDIETLRAENQQLDGHKLSLAVDRKLLQWLILHIRNLDRKMVEYIKSQQSA